MTFCFQPRQSNPVIEVIKPANANFVILSLRRSLRQQKIIRDIRLPTGNKNSSKKFVTISNTTDNVEHVQSGGHVTDGSYSFVVEYCRPDKVSILGKDELSSG
jgi:hypothetical protein